MSWLKLSITSKPAVVDTLTELLEKFGAVSVSLRPRTDEPVFADPTETTTYWEQTTVSALFEDGLDLDVLLACVRNQIGTENILDHGISLMHDQDWAQAHKKDAGAMVFGGNRLCVCPGWVTPPAGIQQVLYLDPGLAFGSGAHHTTALCLDWLASRDVSGKRVIDYGCGSGILGIAAALLGAARVHAVDIDRQAVQITCSNAARNAVSDRLKAAEAGAVSLPTADILLANILLNPLIGLASTFNTLLNPGGALVVSGILATQAEQCRDSYRHWFTMEQPVYRGEWALLTGTRYQQP